MTAKVDKVALERTAQFIETLYELDPTNSEESADTRKELHLVIEQYLTNINPADDTLESLASARESLYQIYRAAGRALQAVSLSKNSANQELAEAFTSALRIIRSQAEIHFNPVN